MVHWNQNKIRKLLLVKIAMLSVATLLIIAANTQSEAKGESTLILETVDRFTLPLEEISGLVLRPGAPGAGPELLVIGDREPRLLAVPLKDLGRASPRSFDLAPALTSRFSPCGLTRSPACERQNRDLTTQWEALATDGAGRVFLLQESTSSVVVFDPSLAKIEATLGVDFFAGEATPPSKKAQRFLGEGLVLLKRGHVLVAKESVPPTIVEFGPAGDAPLGLTAESRLAPGEAFALPPAAGDERARIELKPLASWSTGSDLGRCDLSEIALGGDGAFYSLSEDCHEISRYETLDPHRFKLQADASWKLPAKVRNPEALVVLARDEFLVGSDRKSRKKNLYRLKAP